MDERNLTVYVVDDDAAVRDSLALLLGLRGHATASFASAEDFLSVAKPDWRGCVIADLRMPGRSGLDMQLELTRRGIPLPVVVVTAHGDVASVRDAFRANAVDFLEKPFTDEALLAAIQLALQREHRRLSGAADMERKQAALAQLTPRERDVIALVVEGMHHRDVGAALGISPRTVEVHKARAMQKLGAGSLPELVRMWQAGK